MYFEANRVHDDEAKCIILKRLIYMMLRLNALS